MKISEHHIRSPLLSVNRSCQTCHKFSEAELTARVENIQENTQRLRNQAMDAVVDLIGDIKDKKGRPNAAQLAEAQKLQRWSQFLLDFVEAENSTGFHAPQEAARLLGESANFARRGQLALRDPQFKPAKLEPPASK